MTIEEMKNISVKTVDRKTLVDRKTVKLNEKASQPEKLKEYCRQIKNPYCYLDGKTVVKISFSSTETTLEDCIAQYLRGL